MEVIVELEVIIELSGTAAKPDVASATAMVAVAANFIVNSVQFKYCLVFRRELVPLGGGGKVGGL